MYAAEEATTSWLTWSRLVIETFDSVLDHKSRLTYAASFPPWQAEPQLAQRAAAFGAKWATSRVDATDRADPFKAQAAKRKVLHIRARV